MAKAQVLGPYTVPARNPLRMPRRLGRSGRLRGSVVAWVRGDCGPVYFEPPLVHVFHPRWALVWANVWMNGEASGALVRTRRSSVGYYVRRVHPEEEIPLLWQAP